MTRLLRVTSYLLLCFGFLGGLSLFGAAQTEQLYRLFLYTMLATGLFVLGTLRREDVQRKEMLVLGLLGVFLLSQVAFRETVAARGYVLLSLGWAALFLTRSTAAKSRRAARILVLALISIGVMEALYGLAQSLAGFDYIGSYHRNMGRIATGTLFNRNHFAGLLNMILPLTMGGLVAGFEQKTRKGRPRSENLAWAWLVLLVCSLMGVAVLLSRSRAGAVSLLLGLVLVALLLSRRRSRGRQGRVGVAAVWVLLAVVLSLAFLVGVDGLLSKFSSAQPALQGRAQVYRDSLRLINDNPWLGIGPGMYQWRFRPYQSIKQQIWFDYAHNDYLQTTAEWGIPIALLIWAWVGWLVYRGIRAFLHSGDPWRRGLALGCTVSIFTVLVHSCVDFNLYIPANLMVFCSILGLSWTLSKEEPWGREGAGWLEQCRLRDGVAKVATDRGNFQ